MLEQIANLASNQDVVGIVILLVWVFSVMFFTSLAAACAVFVKDSSRLGAIYLWIFFTALFVSLGCVICLASTQSDGPPSTVEKTSLDPTSKVTENEPR